MENKIFILGIGAQKSGTSWLYHYLKKHPNVNLGFMKEYHVFDALYLNHRKVRENILQSRINRVVNDSRKPTIKDVLLLKFLGDPHVYFQYFKSLVDKKAETSVTGDITPSYAALNAEAFSEIRQQILQYGFKAKVIFLMRDPVERCISLSRMILKYAGAEMSTQTESTHLRQHFASPEYAVRTRYDVTIKNVEAVFNPDEIYYAFYEELFKESTIKNLCNYLEIPYIEPDFSHQPNKSRTTNEIPEALKCEIANFYRPVYEHISAKFGEDKIKNIWPSSQLLMTESH